jgi:nucleoside-diphosphate-sugar epimerase
VDIRDVVEAVTQGLAVPLTGHHRALLCAENISGSQTALELANRLAPTVPVRHAGWYVAHPSRALIDCRAAHRILRWRAAYGQDGHAHPR